MCGYLCSGFRLLDHVFRRSAGSELLSERGEDLGRDRIGKTVQVVRTGKS